MGVRHFSPADRPPVRFVADEELAYVAARAREVHDIWHVLFDCPTTVQVGARLHCKIDIFAPTSILLMGHYVL